MIKKLSAKINFEISMMVLVAIALAFLFALNLPDMVDSWIQKEYHAPLQEISKYR